VDRHAIVALIPIVFVLVVGLLIFTRTRLGQALATRIEGNLPAPETQARLDALENDVDLLRHQLADAEERQDYSERLLAAQRDHGALRNTPVA
jgi:hypothetical protein